MSLLVQGEENHGSKLCKHAVVSERAHNFERLVPGNSVSLVVINMRERPPTYLGSCGQPSLALEFERVVAKRVGR